MHQESEDDETYQYLYPWVMIFLELQQPVDLFHHHQGIQDIRMLDL